MQSRKKPTLSLAKRSGFTLIELLVVIAIIAILAAILFPVFAQAKLSAKKTAAISNSKQHGTSMMMYMTDFDDQFPILAYGGAFAYDFTPNVVSWPEAMQPYIKNWQMYRDPTDPTANDDTYIQNWGIGPNPTAKDLNLARGYGSSYGLNYAFLSPGRILSGVETWVGGISGTSVSEVSNTVMFVDGTAYGATGAQPDCRGVGGGWFQQDAPAVLDAAGNNIAGTDLWNQGWYFRPADGCPWNIYGGGLPRYHGKFNVSWADSHVSTRSPRSLLEGMNYDTGTPSNSRVTDTSKYVWDRN